MSRLVGAARCSCLTIHCMPSLVGHAFTQNAHCTSACKEMHLKECTQAACMPPYVCRTLFGRQHSRVVCASAMGPSIPTQQRHPNNAHGATDVRYAYARLCGFPCLSSAGMLTRSEGQGLRTFRPDECPCMDCMHVHTRTAARALRCATLSPAYAC